MSTLLQSTLVNGNIVYNQRSEREVLQEQLRHWDNMSKQLENVRATIKRRLAEIERETVERERSEYVQV